MEKGFYMVYVEGAGAPARRHDTYDSAYKEAVRLVKKDGGKVYILSTLRCIDLAEYVESDCRPLASRFI